MDATEILALKHAVTVEQPPNHNPLIARDQIDTLVNVHAVMQFLHDCDLLSDNVDYRFKPRSADGLYLIGEAALQALRFEIDHRKVINPNAQTPTPQKTTPATAGV